MFDGFFSSLVRSRYLFIFSLSFNFSVVNRDSKDHNFASSPLLLIKIPDRFVCFILKDWCWVGHIPFVRVVKFKFLAQFPMDHFAHPVVYALYSFCANLLHLLIIRLMVSFLSLYNLYLLFCCVLCILASILIVLFCVAIWRNSVSLFRFLFLSHVHVIFVCVRYRL